MNALMIECVVYSINNALNRKCIFTFFFIKPLVITFVLVLWNTKFHYGVKGTHYILHWFSPFRIFTSYIRLIYFIIINSQISRQNNKVSKQFLTNNLENKPTLTLPKSVSPKILTYPVHGHVVFSLCINIYILYRMIKSLCTPDRQSQGDTRLTLTPSVIYNSKCVNLVGY